eukprot:TRINITY_DN65953_c0_g1_i1.p1 TRINITY_DN65953_c0_g1~~TRINITY_DN65953_c0_g1_i1.p1  ORF type:complete len:588 (+),score=143.78 TRINITY_DN65953_c0_g1_i1:74-1837(+)
MLVRPVYQRKVPLVAAVAGAALCALLGAGAVSLNSLLPHSRRAPPAVRFLTASAVDRVVPPPPGVSQGPVGALSFAELPDPEALPDWHPRGPDGTVDGMLGQAARAAPCGDGCGGLLVSAVADEPYAKVLHAWLLYLDRVTPGGLGRPGSGVVPSAADEGLLAWCKAAGVPCVLVAACSWLRRRLLAAAEAGYMQPARARTIAPQWCKVYSMRALLARGFAVLMTDLDVIPLQDPVPTLLTLMKQAPGALYYQCGERLMNDDRLTGAWNYWPNTGQLFAQPRSVGAGLIMVAVDEGVWQAVNIMKTGRRLRPRIPCRDVLLRMSLATTLKNLLAKFGSGRGGSAWKTIDLARMCALYDMPPKCKPPATVPPRNKMRLIRNALATEIMAWHAAGNITLPALRKRIGLYCDRFPPMWCRSVDDAIARLGVTSGGDTTWELVDRHCSDMTWGEQEVLREILETLPEMLAARRVPHAEPSARALAAHRCLPSVPFAMAFDAPGKAGRMIFKRPRLHKPSNRTITLHLTGSDGRPGNASVHFSGGLERLLMAQRIKVIPRPRCLSAFAEDAPLAAAAAPPGMPCGPIEPGSA